MDAATRPMYRRESTFDLHGGKRLRPYGKDTAQALVRRVSGAAGSDAGACEPTPGIAVHCAVSVVPGAVYAEQRQQRRWLRRGGGALYLANWTVKSTAR